MGESPKLAAKAVAVLWAPVVGHALFTTILLFPLLKKGCTNEATNYRPIALLSHTRKLIEKVGDWQLRSVYILDDAQCGFQPSKSVETAILRARRAYAEDHVMRVFWI